MDGRGNNRRAFALDYGHLERYRAAVGLDRSEKLVFLEFALWRHHVTWRYSGEVLGRYREAFAVRVVALSYGPGEENSVLACRRRELESLIGLEKLRASVLGRCLAHR